MVRLRRWVLEKLAHGRRFSQSPHTSVPTQPRHLPLRSPRPPLEFQKMRALAGSGDKQHHGGKHVGMCCRARLSHDHCHPQVLLDRVVKSSLFPAPQPLDGVHQRSRGAFVQLPLKPKCTSKSARPYSPTFRGFGWCLLCAQPSA